jgi:hypothetical protein
MTAPVPVSVSVSADEKNESAEKLMAEVAQAVDTAVLHRASSQGPSMDEQLKSSMEQNDSIASSSSSASAPSYIRRPRSDGRSRWTPNAGKKINIRHYSMTTVEWNEKICYDLTTWTKKDPSYDVEAAIWEHPDFEPTNEAIFAFARETGNNLHRLYRFLTDERLRDEITPSGDTLGWALLGVWCEMSEHPEAFLWLFNRVETTPEQRGILMERAHDTGHYRIQHAIRCKLPIKMVNGSDYDPAMDYTHMIAVDDTEGVRAYIKRFPSRIFELAQYVSEDCASTATVCMIRSIHRQAEKDNTVGRLEQN